MEGDDITGGYTCGCEIFVLLRAQQSAEVQDSAPPSMWMRTSGVAEMTGRHRGAAKQTKVKRCASKTGGERERFPRTPRFISLAMGRRKIAIQPITVSSLP